MCNGYQVLITAGGVGGDCSSRALAGHSASQTAPPDRQPTNRVTNNTIASDQHAETADSAHCISHVKRVRHAGVPPHVAQLLHVAGVAASVEQLHAAAGAALGALGQQHVTCIAVQGRHQEHAAPAVWQAES